MTHPWPRWAAPAGILLLCACSETTLPSDSTDPVQVTVSFAACQVKPNLFAYRDGGGTWQTLPPGAESYTFPIRHAKGGYLYHRGAYETRSVS